VGIGPQLAAWGLGGENAPNRRVFRPFVFSETCIRPLAFLASFGKLVNSRAAMTGAPTTRTMAWMRWRNACGVGSCADAADAVALAGMRTNRMVDGGGRRLRLSCCGGHADMLNPSGRTFFLGFLSGSHSRISKSRPLRHYHNSANLENTGKGSDLGRVGYSRKPMATLLAPVDAREVVRCDCGLVQFIPSAGLCSPCRRCRQPLDREPETDEPEPSPKPVPLPTRAESTLSAQLAAAIKSRRLQLGLSQRTLAERLHIPRTYISKCEQPAVRSGAGVTPTLSTLTRLARALEVSIPDLLAGVNHDREAEIRALMDDPFIAQLLEYMPRISEPARRAILMKVHDMVLLRHAA
jgi:transcriptional regulator with XRE-family HTH domain